MNRVTILGGLGFLGGHISRCLVNAGHDVSIFDRPKPLPLHLHGLDQQAQIIAGDATDPEAVLSAIKQAHTVIHLIHSTVPASSMQNPGADVMQNVVSSVAWLSRLHETQVQRLIYVSSGGTVYGIPQSTPIQEDHPTNPTSSYGITKLMLEKYVALYADLNHIDYRILRPSNVYGIGQKLRVAQGVIGVMISHALRQEPFELWGDGQTIRDYLYVDDLAHAVNLLLNDVGDARLYNVGTGEGHSVNDIIDIVRQTTGTNFEIIRKPATAFGVPVNILDTTRLRATLGWQPKTNLEEGIQRTVDWMKTTI